jgi:hypothetical protein
MGIPDIWKYPTYGNIRHMEISDIWKYPIIIKLWKMPREAPEIHPGLCP